MTRTAPHSSREAASVQHTDINAALARYRAAGARYGEPLLLDIGEPAATGGTPSDTLLHYLRRHAATGAGYHRHPAGLEQARNTFREYLRADHHLGTVHPSRYDVMVTTSGTRSVMYHYARHLLETSPGNASRQPVALVAAPTWDYHGPLAAAGIRPVYWPLREAHGWLPDIDDLDAAIAGVDTAERVALCVINAQHNPTGRNWPEQFVRQLIHRASSMQAAVLIDDAYYGVHTAEVRPTSALRVVLEESTGATSGANLSWLAVRSFGKQFRCNGWQIGAVVSSSATLHSIANSMFALGFPSGCDRQLAVADYLSDPLHLAELEQFNTAIEHNRGRLNSVLRLSRWPEELIHPAEATPYALIAAPRNYRPNNCIEHWRRDLAELCGIATSAANIEQPADTPDNSYVRIYLGTARHIIADALGRLVAAGFHYDMPVRGAPRSRVGAAIRPLVDTFRPAVNDAPWRGIP